MGALENIMRFGYSLIVVALALMLWASYARAREVTEVHSPCVFNALCTCSKSWPDLGIVTCKNEPFPSIPRALQHTKVYSLHMENTGLRSVDPISIQDTGLYELHLSNNHLKTIPENSFIRLSRSLQELALHGNQLINIPTQALAYLRKLRRLDLSGNDIMSIDIDSFRTINETLQALSLADNSISTIALGSLSSLPMLETLDLSGNNLMQIDDKIFKDMNRLNKILFADNMLTTIPYVALSSLKVLRYLDMANNRIESLINEDMNLRQRLTLDTLHLEYNDIKELPSESFKYFDTINKTFLDVNPLETIQLNAFGNTKIRELYIRHCGLTYIDPEAFSSLEGSLVSLDLSGNNISNLPEKLFYNFAQMRNFNVKDNNILHMITNVPFKLNLHMMDTSGDQNMAMSFKDMKNIESLRSLSISKMPTNAMTPDDFLNFGVELEDLKITRAGLRTLKSHAFTHVRGIKRLDLSENRIDAIEKEAFNEVGHSLTSLKMSRGLASSMSQLPTESLKFLTSLEEIDLSNNKIKQVSDTSFHFLKKLQIVELHDNLIENLQKGTFQSKLHTDLREVSLGFNKIKFIGRKTFANLDSLKIIKLDDNQIGELDKFAFMNLEQLERLQLRGNKITKISEEAFSNLQMLKHLDLAYNNLNKFDFNYLDNVGSLVSLHADFSHNSIDSLDNNRTASISKDFGSSSSIKFLDFSHNNISYIEDGFFRPAEKSLMRLYLNNNKLNVATKDLFGSMYHLQWLDLSHNEIFDVEYDTFQNTTNLQVLDLSNNQLAVLRANVFKPILNLRIVDLSHNRLASLPDSTISNEGLEILNLAHNKFMKIPITSMSNLASLTLCELDLSHNLITAIHSADLSNKFRSMSLLDLSNNRLMRLENAAFAALPQLVNLDLSHNDELAMEEKAFVGLETSLISLDLTNVSLNAIPDLPLSALRILKVGYNNLTHVSDKISTNLQELDLSENNLTSIPSEMSTLSFPYMKWLSFNGNPIESVSNENFARLSNSLEHLDLGNLDLEEYHSDILDRLQYLRSFKTSTYLKLPNYNIPKLVENLHNLRNLWIDCSTPAAQPKEPNGKPPKPLPPLSDLRREMDGQLPLKLRHVTFSGNGLTKLADTVLSGVQSAVLHVSFVDTSLPQLSPNIFKFVERVKNISLDFHSGNKQLKNIPNPNSAHYLHLPNTIFLTDLKISGSSYQCDCELGWIEFWQRKKRQYVCSTQKWSDDVFGTAYKASYSSYDEEDECSESIDDLREVKCSNKNNKSLVEVLKYDLECGWGSSGMRLGVVPAIAFACVLIVLMI